VALIGFPSVGKSSLLSTLTDTSSEAAGYEFTTLTCIPGNLHYNDTKIQLLDLPGIIEGAASGRGRGKEVIAVARSADLVLMVLDAVQEENNQHRDILTRELETMGIRLNQHPPDLYFRKKNGGGIKFNATVPLTKLGDDPERVVNRILHEYRIHNAEVLMREDCSTDELIDVLEGNRRYVKCLYVYNKIDSLSIEEVDQLARQDHSLVISVHMALNLEELKRRMWEYLGLVRIYTKPKGKAPDLTEPVILSKGRGGLTVRNVCDGISRELLNVFNYALVWGRSARHNAMRVGLQHVLSDEDVITIVGKTVTQQRHDRDYSKRVEAHYKAMRQRNKNQKQSKK